MRLVPVRRYFRWCAWVFYAYLTFTCDVILRWKCVKRIVIKKCLNQEAGKICTAIFIFNSPPLVYISSNNCSTLLVWVSFQFIPWYQISFNILINIFEFLCFNQTPETINRNVFILVDVDVQFETENLSFNLICVKIIQGVPNLRDRLWFPKMWSAFVVISYLP